MAHGFVYSVAFSTLTYPLTSILCWPSRSTEYAALTTVGALFYCNLTAIHAQHRKIPLGDLLRVPFNVMGDQTAPEAIIGAVGQ